MRKTIGNAVELDEAAAEAGMEGYARIREAGGFL
jgi:hypothetical protein